VISLLLEDSASEAATAGAVLILAVLQGVAEFLPISSSGHLVIGREVLGLRDAGLALDVALHLGTLGAVWWAYRRDVGAIIGDLFAGRLHMVLWLVLATLPVGLAGVLGKPVFKDAAQSSTVAGCGFLITALFLILGDRARRRQGAPATEGEEQVRPAFSLAVILGLAQMLAICPGISRSGTTIAVGLLLGLPVLQAARLSFLMSLPAVAGAAVYELPGAISDGIGQLSNGLVLGAMVIAGLVGWVSLRVLLVVTARGAFPWFAGYCVLAAGLTLTLL
jgi:undecaprenyl-diphosphatase